MDVKWLFRLYRGALLTTLMVAYTAALIEIVALLVVAPKVLLWLIDVLSPVSQFFRDMLLGLFPEVRWLQRGGEWMGQWVRRGLSLTDARTEAITRMTLLDGAVVMCVLAWGSGIILRLWVNIQMMRWFNMRYEIVRRMPEEKSELPPLRPRLPRGPSFEDVLRQTKTRQDHS